MTAPTTQASPTLWSMRLALVLLCGLVLWDTASPGRAFPDAELRLTVSGDELAISSQYEYSNLGKRTRGAQADTGDSHDGDASSYPIRAREAYQALSPQAIPRSSFEGVSRRSILTLPQAPRAPPRPSVPA